VEALDADIGDWLKNAVEDNDQNLKFSVIYADRGAPGEMLLSLCAEGK
jgi:hypothetical protein